MKHTLLKRLTAAALCLLMVAGQLPKTNAASQQPGYEVTWKPVDNSRVTAEFLPEGDSLTEESPYAPEEMVRVSIVLSKKPTLSVYGDADLASNTWAVSYRQALQNRQNDMAAAISAAALDGEKLDVVWNLTLAANAISANVPYGSLDAIRAVPGVAEVFLEQRYDPCVGEAVHEPKMQISVGMTGTTQAWAGGYTGAGTRIAVIDTGLDTEHQSVSEGAFLHSLELLAREENMTVDAFMAQRDLLDKGELSGILTQLNAYTRSYEGTDKFYVSAKIPFGFNYVDSNFTLHHMSDSMSDHGSHVAGISAANRFIPDGAGGYGSAMERVSMTGAAPDAQILVMKVFGVGGGAYEADYMAAIEDAIVLGCDTVNLSLGAPNPGMTTSDYYSDVLRFLQRSGTVATIAAGNSGDWAASSHTPNGLPYAEDAIFQTTGSPSTYPEALSVASVNNDGMVSRGFYVPDRSGRFVAYGEPANKNRQTLGSLDESGNGTAVDFIWMDSIGTSDDYSNIPVTGKVVFCARGNSTFSEKATVAAEKGALALVVYNNEPGSFSMNLDDYSGTMPCVSISGEDGTAIRATTEDRGGYRTGRMLITKNISGSNWDTGYYTMSSFSSWGVPGDLSMKPEITAPGGNIWSLKGTESTHDQYQSMSGTSMAAPQMAGIGALVQQAIAERGLSCVSLSDRALTQSLLMSTATPMKDAFDAYYPILQQGAGLVDAGAATSADSCITVEGMGDGKVKVELGDDPRRTGEYSFTFTIHNLDGAERSYALSGDVFTQDVKTENGFDWMARHTRALRKAVTRFTAAETLRWDFDGNGVEGTVADGQALLAYASGHRDAIQCRDYADFSGDGAVTTYDAHLFLNREAQAVTLASTDTVTVPAGGSVDVTATITLDKGEMDELLQTCTNGVYLQAYIFATALADGEGSLGTAHSIPVLGFYGNWSDPTMFDKGSYQYYHYRLYGTDTPYVPYLGSEDVNTFMVTYGGNNTISYALGGNPVDLQDAYGAPVQLDREYLESRNALNNSNRDMVYSLRHTAIRNSAATRFTATDANTGVVYYTGEQRWDQYSAYYNPNSGEWESTNYSPYIGWAGTDQYGYALPENTVVNLAYTRAPEYYENADGSIRWGDLGAGASFTTQVTIDNTAPQLIEASAANNDLTVTVHDNQYVAAVILLDSSGDRQLAYAGGNQMQKNVRTDVTMHVDDIVGKTFLLQIYDYAMNASTFEVSITGMEPSVSNYYTGYSKDDRAWFGIEEDGTSGVYALDSREITAAERVEDLVFAVDSTQDNTANLYVMPADDLAKIQSVGVIRSPYPEDTFYIADMAYHYPDQTMYFVYSTGYSGYNGCYGLAAVDLLTGQVDYDSYGALGADLRGLAIDESGNFYGIGDNYRLYTYRKDSFSHPQAKDFALGSLTGSPSRISMTWDAGKDELVLADHRAAGRSLYAVNVQNGEMRTVSTETKGTLWGLHMDTGLDSGLELSQTHVPTHVFMSEDSVKVLLNATYSLKAAAYPWTLSDRSVIYSSSNNAVASVDQDGQITGNSIGTCTITATSRLDPSVSAQCAVEVTNIKADLTALIGRGGQSYWSAFHTETLADYQTIRQSPNKLVSATASSDGWIYGATWIEKDSSTLYRVDPNTLEETRIGPASLRGFSYPLADLADAPNLGSGNQYLVGISQEAVKNSIVILERSSGAIVGVVNNQLGLTSQLTAITYAGKMEHPQNGTFDTYYALDYDGNVYWIGMQVQEVSPDGLLTMSLLGRTENYRILETKRNTDYIDFYNTIHYTRDSSGTPMLFWSYYRWREPIQMLAIDADKSGSVETLGTFPGEVTFAGGLMDKNTISVSQVSAADVAVVQTGVNDLEAFHAATVGRNRADAAQIPSSPADMFSRSSASAVASPAASDGVTVEQSGTGREVRLTLKADKATTNGLLRIVYDPTVLTFVADRGDSTLYSGKLISEGTVTVGYADRTARGAGAVLSQLTFTAAQDYFTTSVTLSVLEEGSQADLENKLSVPVVREPVRHTVTFDLNGGQGTAPVSQNVIHGEKAKQPPAPSRSGYDFLYWSASPGGSAYSFDTAVTGDLKLYAIWQQRTHMIQASVGGPGGSISPSGEVTVKEGESMTFRITPDAGYEIAQVLADGVSQGAVSSYTFRNVTGDHSLVVSFAPLETEPTIPETEPTIPDTEPTVPETQPTEPKPTEPKPTEPKPTEPKPTEPKPTEPKPTEPKPTDPKPTEPEETKPQVPVCKKDKTCILSRFEDIIVTDWYHDGIHFCVEEGIMNGMGEGAFAPNENTTRAQLVMMLYRLAGTPSVEGKTEPFADVSNNDWFYAPIVWAFENKVVNGVSATEFAPNASVTREQVATILHRYLGEPEGTGKLEEFPDVADVSAYAVAPLTWAVGEGLITGIAQADGTALLAPTGNATRAQIATILMRYLTK